MTRILIILIPDDDGSVEEPILRLERFTGPFYVFRDAGAEVILASPDGGSPWGRLARARLTAAAPFSARFQADREAQEAMTDTLRLDQVFPDDFAAAFCIGTPGPVWRDTPGKSGGSTIAQFLAAGKPVAVIPSALDLEPCGTGDGLLITGDNARSPLLAAHALLAALGNAPL